MWKYILKRILLALFTVFLICVITFALMNAIPGGPFNKEKALSEATIASLNARYNLDKPLYVQFFMYMKNLLHGDFGVALKMEGKSKESLVNLSLFPAVLVFQR